MFRASPAPIFFYHMGFPGSSSGKKPPDNAGDIKRHRFHPWVGKISGEGNGNHSSTFAWRITWTVELGRLESMGSQRVRYDWAPDCILIRCYVANTWDVLFYRTGDTWKAKITSTSYFLKKKKAKLKLKKPSSQFTPTKLNFKSESDYQCSPRGLKQSH